MRKQTTLTGKSRVAFLLGCPVEHSLSPAMHNEAFQALGLDAVYAALEVSPERVGAAVETVRSASVLGANVTVPHKEAVIAHLDRLDPEAKWLRSVNTLYKREGKLCGASTDGPGFLRALGPHAKKVQGSRVLLIGAGGGSRSVAGALVGAGAKRVLVMDLAKDRVENLVRLMRQRRKGVDAAGVTREEAERGLGDFSLIVQATPVGLHVGDPSPILLSNARRGALAFDLVYHRKTEFQKSAEKKGLVTLDGLGMLLHQGVLSFEFWTGKKAPIGIMRKALCEALGRRG